MGSCPSAPINDAFCNAQELVPASGGTVFSVGDTFVMDIQGVDGTNDGSDCQTVDFGFFTLPFLDTEDVPICQDIGSPIGNLLPDPRFGVWYKLTIDSDCEVDLTLSTCETTTPFDTAIAVYEANGDFDCGEAIPDLMSLLSCVDAADDTCSGNSVLTELSLSQPLSVSGTKTVYIMVYSGNSAADIDFVFGVGDFRLEGSVQGLPGCGAGGDPHFNRWRQAKHDSFHGECDLVLLRSEQFHDKTGVDVHVRTTMMENDFSFSYVESSAVKVGDTILEFHPKFFRVNGEDYDYDAVPSFEFEERGRTYKISSVMTSATKRETTLQLDDQTSIKIRSTKNLMYVNFEGSKAAFYDSVGMLGNYTTGDMYGRDGALFEQDFLHYGFEWQVDPLKNDPILFKENRAPQLPYEKCRLPIEAPVTSRRRLRSENSAMRDQAIEACQNAKTDFELCVDDVMATNNVEAAEMFL